jgi:hypothetical protein
MFHTTGRTVPLRFLEEEGGMFGSLPGSGRADYYLCKATTDGFVVRYSIHQPSVSASRIHVMPALRQSEAESRRYAATNIVFGAAEALHGLDSARSLPSH